MPNAQYEFHGPHDQITCFHEAHETLTLALMKPHSISHLSGGSLRPAVKQYRLLMIDNDNSSVQHGELDHLGLRTDLGIIV